VGDRYLDIYQCDAPPWWESWSYHDHALLLDISLTNEVNGESNLAISAEEMHQLCRANGPR